MKTYHSNLLRSILFSLCIAIIEARPTFNNGTVVLPDEITNHGDPNLLCKPANVADILLFLVGNYIAHVATTRVEPWEGTAEYVLAVLAALLLPGSGIIRGLRAIISRARFATTDLETAARASALCTLVRTKDFRRSNGALIYLDQLHKSHWRSPEIHGRYKVPIPDEYTVVVVPRNAQFEDTPPDMKSSICCNYNATKIIVALGQSVFSCVTLYRTKGDQLSQYGYAAFGLTVAPYAFMSIINLLGNLLCPEYPTMYLVESQALIEARQAEEAKLAIEEAKLAIEEEEESEALLKTSSAAQNAKGKGSWYFEGAVGKLSPDYERKMLESNRMWYDILLTSPMALFLSAVPIAIIGIISKFEQGNSTHAQRAWVMTWVVVGAAVGSFSYWVTAIVTGTLNPEGLSTFKDNFLGGLFWTLVYSAPAIGGFVVVIQMLSTYGICFRIT